MSEKLVLEAFERGKAFGYAEGLKASKASTREMTTKMLYRDLEILDLLKLRFIRDPDNKDVYVGRTTDEELDKYEEILKKGTREMNTHELAVNLLEGVSPFLKKHGLHRNSEIVSNSAMMLRQQQAEIEALKEVLVLADGHMKLYLKHYTEGHNVFEALKKAQDK